MQIVNVKKTKKCEIENMNMKDGICKEFSNLE